MTMSPTANTSGWPGSVRSGSTAMRPARSVSAPVASASVAASGDACTPAAQTTVRAAMRSVPSFVSTSTPRPSTLVTRAFIRSSTPRSLELAGGARRQPVAEGRERLLAAVDEHDPHRRGIERAELAAQAAGGELADLPGELDSGGTGAHDDDGEPFRPLLGGSVAVSAISNAPRMRRRSSRASSIVFMPGREQRELVVAEVGLTGPGGDDQGVVGQLDVLVAGRSDRVHDAAFEIEPVDLEELDRDAGKAAQHVSERRRDLARARACRSRPGTAAAGRDGGCVGRRASPRRPRRDRGSGPRASRRSLPRRRPRGASLVLHACARRRRTVYRLFMSTCAVGAILSASRSAADKMRSVGRGSRSRWREGRTHAGALRRHHHRHRRGRRDAGAHARRRRGSGSCCSNAATSCRARWRTGIPTRCSSTVGTSRRTRGTTPTAPRSSRRCTTSSAARPSCTAPRCTGSDPQDFGELQHVDGAVAGLAGVLRRLRAVLHEGRVALPGARQPRRGPDRGALEQAVPVAGGVARAAHPAAVRRARRHGGYHPFHAPCGILLDEADRARSTCIRCTWCDGYPCLVHAKSDAETIAVRPDARAAERDAARRRRGDAARDRRVRSARSRSVVVARGRRRRGVRAPTWSWCRPAPRTAPRSCCARRTTGTRTASPTAPTRSGRNYMFHNSKAVVALVEGAQRDGLPEDARRSTTSTSAPTTTDWPVGNIQMVGKSNAAAMKGEEPKLTKLAPHWSLADIAEHAVDFWLTTEDLPKPENRVTLDGDGERPPRVPRRPTTTRPTASTTS